MMDRDQFATAGMGKILGAVQQRPFITVIVPVRNEAANIKRALHSIMRNSYPPQLVEIIVVDGNSDDGTPGIVRKIAEQDSRVKLISNPAKFVPQGWNRALKCAKGDVIVRIDGHATVNDDFLETVVQVLQEHPECIAVGGVVIPVGVTPWQKAVAYALRTFIGAGSARFRSGSRYVNTVSFPAFRKEAFERYGSFDERFIRSQDYEFNLRLVLAGEKIWQDPRIKVEYYPRSTLRGLWKQYWQYGFWKVRALWKHRYLNLVNLIVPGFWSLLFATGLASLWSAYAAISFYVLTGSYLAVLAVHGLAGAYKARLLTNLILVPVALLSMHLSFGLGFIWGVVTLLARRGRA